METEVGTSEHQHIRVVRVNNGWIVMFAVFTDTVEREPTLARGWELRQRVFTCPTEATSFVGHYLTTDPVTLATETEGPKPKPVADPA